MQTQLLGPSSLLLAKEKGVSGEAILIAWILRHPAKIQASCQAGALTLPREEWYKLFNAGRGERLP